MMTDFQTDTPTPSRVIAAHAQIFVTDIAAATAFYAGKLGFAVTFTYGKPPFYGQVFRGGARLNLRCVPSPVLDPRLRDEETLLSASITVDNIEPLFLEYRAAEVAFHRTMTTEPWGARNFIVRDPDGNLLLFAGHGEVDEIAPAE